MKFLDDIWTVIICVTNWATVAPFDGSPNLPHKEQYPFHSHGSALDPLASQPIFDPPGGDPDHDQIKCDYRNMGPDWKPCSTPEDRGCWLRHTDGREYNIHTDYENDMPIGIQRNYTLVVHDGIVNADGKNFASAKLFNNSFPGPWIQACWGDTVNVTVINKLQWNGTSIHWHGIRQLNTTHMDGVNGITQCPIAPHDSFSYVWKTWQYGSSWYHSHYSVQYADGLQGPLTIHGPSSSNWDEPKVPLLMTDWGNNSAFEAIHSNQTNKLLNQSVLLNGRGNVTKFYNVTNTSAIPHPDELYFEAEEISMTGLVKRYLLRLINTSFDTTFIFSIDNHEMEVISADFVPIEPYRTTSVLIGIGQRYNVIVDAKPTGKNLQKNGNYWIRTFVADTCGNKGVLGYETTGILRYDPKSKVQPNSTSWQITTHCSDEPYSFLRPILPWTVGKPVNPEFKHESSLKPYGERFDLTGNTAGLPVPKSFPLAFFDLQRPKTPDKFTPLQVNYTDPMFFHLNELHRKKWPGLWAVVPENFTSKDWVYLVIGGAFGSSSFNAHPIHLHGHDFAILQQVEGAAWSPENFNPKLDNPPRRDVVLLPNNGFVVIAFKTDNPGPWLMHCHIAIHISIGLGLQVLERQKDADDIWPHGHSPALAEAERVCGKWRDWERNCMNLWPGKQDGTYPSCDDKAYIFQDDSGV